MISIWRIRAIVRRVFWRLFDWMAGKRNQRRALGHVYNKLVSLKHSNRPIRVGFIVCSPAKWSANSLFLALKDNPAFDCGFICCLSDTDLRLKKPKRRLQYNGMREFFAALGPIWHDLYHDKMDRMHDPASIDCDIVFIQQPWGMQDFPRLLSGRILSAYLHYGFAIISNDRMQFQLPDFHRYLWAYFAQTEAHARTISADKNETVLLPCKVQAVGYPKLDGYLIPANKNAGHGLWPRSLSKTRKRVIFAPHHAVGAATLNMATFHWSSPTILDLARQYPEMDFILKPHPNLAHAYKNRKNYGGQSYEQWSVTWRNMPNCGVFDSGLYFDLFNSSDLMITDSGSFLAEYLPTGQPIIRLVSSGAQPFNASGQQLNDAFYVADDSTGLQQVFKQIAVGKTDPLASVRQDKRSLILPFDKPAAEMIIDSISECMERAGPNDSPDAKLP